MSRKQKNITACFYLVIFCTICKNDIRKKVKNKVPTSGPLLVEEAFLLVRGVEGVDISLQLCLVIFYV